MTKERTLNVIRERVDSNTALRNAAGLTNGVPVFVEGSVLYPYFAFNARCTVATMAGSRSMSVDCLVDGINGLGATADSYSTGEVTACDDVQLQTKVAVDDAQRTAQRTVTHRLGKQLKMIAPFDVQLEAAGTIYKRFWIMRVGDGRIMADSVTGNMHSLNASAA
jgi:hypothetical protein